MSFKFIMGVVWIFISGGWFDDPVMNDTKPWFIRLIGLLLSIGSLLVGIYLIRMYG